MFKINSQIELERSAGGIWAADVGPPEPQRASLFASAKKPQPAVATGRRRRAINRVPIGRRRQQVACGPLWGLGSGLSALNKWLGRRGPGGRGSGSSGPSFVQPVVLHPPPSQTLEPTESPQPAASRTKGREPLGLARAMGPAPVTSSNHLLALLHFDCLAAAASSGGRRDRRARRDRRGGKLLIQSARRRSGRFD